MKRTHSLFSLTSLLITGVFLSGLAYMIWRNGNLLFSPGQVSARQLSGVRLGGFASHAEFESDCARCHAPLATTQDQLCLACHSQVEKEISSQEGIHAHIEQVNQCYRCHSEHQGRRFDPGVSARPKFDHSQADFSLVKHQVDYSIAPIDCTACHQDDAGFTTPPEKCVICHADYDRPFTLRHITDFGENCIGCHDGVDTLSEFMHDSSTFSLTGKHAGLTCANCHADYRLGSGNQAEMLALTLEVFRNTPVECAACHAEPQVHAGMFSLGCIECHNQVAWSPAFLDGTPFRHAENTNFSLGKHARDYDGSPLVCQDCHQGNLASTFEIQVCADCHSAGNDPTRGSGSEFMVKHVERYGADCLDCHDGVDRLSDFEHAQVFPLEGMHAELDCAACHQEQVFRGAPSQCAGCHAEPEIHAGSFGLQCQYCHTVDTWTPANLRFHNFPLDHGDDSEVACTTCHVASYDSYTCYGCHEHQPDPIREEHLEEGVDIKNLEACNDCHPDGREE